MTTLLIAGGVGGLLTFNYFFFPSCPVLCLLGSLVPKPICKFFRGNKADARHEMLQNGNAVFLDVRNEDEVAAAPSPAGFVNVPLPGLTLEGLARAVGRSREALKTTPIGVICARGSRAASGIDKLKDEGCTVLENLTNCDEVATLREEIEEMKKSKSA